MDKTVESETKHISNCNNETPMAIYDVMTREDGRRAENKSNADLTKDLSSELSYTQASVFLSCFICSF